MEIFSCPTAPTLVLGTPGVHHGLQKKTILIVTGVSHYHVLQHWVGGYRGCCNSTCWCRCGCFFWRTRYHKKLVGYSHEWLSVIYHKLYNVLIVVPKLDITENICYSKFLKFIFSPENSTLATSLHPVEDAPPHKRWPPRGPQIGRYRWRIRTPTLVWEGNYTQLGQQTPCLAILRACQHMERSLGLTKKFPFHKKQYWPKGCRFTFCPKLHVGFIVIGVRLAVSRSTFHFWLHLAILEVRSCRLKYSVVYPSNLYGVYISHATVYIIYISDDPKPRISCC